MILNLKTTSAIILSLALALMFVEPTPICAQKSKSKSKGGGGSARSGGGGSNRGSASLPSTGGSRGGSRGSTSSQSRGGNSSGRSGAGGGSRGGLSSSRGASSTNGRGGATSGRSASGNASPTNAAPSYSGSDYSSKSYAVTYSVYRPSYNQFYYGPSEFGDGIGMSVGTPLNRYHDYYDVAPLNYVEAASQLNLNEYVLPGGSFTESVEHGQPSPTASTPATDDVISAPAVSSTMIVAAGMAGKFQAQAELAFREHRYEDAARWSNHAVIEDSENGKLHLFASQVFLALGDYRASAASLQLGASLLDRSQWGYVVENYKDFYRGRDYGTQMAALVEFTWDNPNQPYAHFLRGYQYKFLGYETEARAPLLRAIELESRDRLAAELLVMAGGKLPDSVAPDVSVSTTANEVLVTEESDAPAEPADKK